MWEYVRRFFQFLVGDSSGDWKNYGVNEKGIFEVSKGEIVQNFAWNDINHVGILTTEDGPWCEDIFYVICTNHGEICITHNHAENIQLLKYFVNLPGFNWGKVAEAMSCTTEARFKCWDRSEW